MINPSFLPNLAEHLRTQDNRCTDKRLKINAPITQAICELEFSDWEEKAGQLQAHASEMEHMLNQLADCYFMHRGAGLMELMMRVDRLTKPKT